MTKPTSFDEQCYQQTNLIKENNLFDEETYDPPDTSISYITLIQPVPRTISIPLFTRLFHPNQPMEHDLLRTNLAQRFPSVAHLQQSSEMAHSDSDDESTICPSEYQPSKIDKGKGLAVCSDLTQKCFETTYNNDDGSDMESMFGDQPEPSASLGCSLAKTNKSTTSQKLNHCTPVTSPTKTKKQKHNIYRNQRYDILSAEKKQKIKEAIAASSLPKHPKKARLEPHQVMMKCIGFRNILTNAKYLIDNGKAGAEEASKVVETLEKIGDIQDLITQEVLDKSKLIPIIKQYRHKMGFEDDVRMKARDIYTLWRQKF
ncbi:hypothetical protein C8J56DRAFT_560485 [Mycena floridula]|nr:hypothetical protein C8J56DRAFT_560485 [Mycena floridula]